MWCLTLWSPVTSVVLDSLRLLKAHIGKEEGSDRQRQTTIHYQSISETPIKLTSICIWVVGGSRSTRRKPTQTWGGTSGEHAKSAEKLEFEPRTFLLWVNSANHSIPVLLIWEIQSNTIWWKTKTSTSARLSCNWIGAQKHRSHLFPIVLLQSSEIKLE